MIHCLFGPMNCFQRESLRAINQMFIHRPKSEVGRKSLRYRGPLLWNYVNKTIDVSSTLSVFKASIRKLNADLEAFCFNKEAATVTMKSKDFIYF